MAAAWVALQPLDAVSFRDGRPFTAGTDTMAVTTLPQPTTIAGAIWAAFGCPAVQRFAGPLLARLAGEGGGLSLFFPCPRDLVRDDDTEQVARLRVPAAGTAPGASDQPSGWHAPLAFPEGNGEALEGCWLTGEQLQRYLAGDTGALCQELAEDGASAALHQPFVEERRVGLARTPGARTAEPGFLYAVDFLRPADDRLCFAGWVEFSGAVPPLARTAVRLGGKGRLAQVHVFPEGEAGGAQLPPPQPPAGDGRVLLYLATPGVFPGGWYPPLPAGAELVAACVQGPEPVAAHHVPEPGQRQGWAHYWAVRPGSVYYLRCSPAAQAAVTAWHGQVPAQADSKLKHLESAGFGLCLVGRW